MSNEQALQILHNIAESTPLNGKDRDTAREAVKTLNDMVQAKPETKKEAVKPKK